MRLNKVSMFNFYLHIKNKISFTPIVFYWIVITLFFPIFSFSQARFNIFNGVYASMGGGTSSSPVYLVVENGNVNAISRTGSGHIISENEYNKIKWHIGTNTGIYQFPLGKGTTEVTKQKNRFQINI